MSGGVSCVVATTTSPSQRRHPERFDMRRTPLIATASVVAAVGALLSTAATGSVAAPRPAAAGASVPADLALVQVRQSLLGSHTWYAQTYRGLPVLGGYYAVHATGATAAVDDGRRPVTGLGTVAPGVARSSAATAAKAHGNARSSRLVVVPGATATLGWEVFTDRDKRVL